MSNDEDPIYYRIDLRFWFRAIIYTALTCLIIMGLVVAVALMAMMLRFINREPDPRQIIAPSSTTVPETTFRTIPPTTIAPTSTTTRG